MAETNNVYKNRGSSLLSKKHSEQIFDLMRPECKSLCTTLVRLRILHCQNSLTWIKKDQDVLCFTKDYSEKNYFLQLYSLKGNRLIWERKLRDVRYPTLSDTFFVLDSKDYVVKFEFLNKHEGKKMNDAVKVKFLNRNEKRRLKIDPQQQPNSKTGFFSKNVPKTVSKSDISVPLAVQHVNTVMTAADFELSGKVQDYDTLTGSLRKPAPVEATNNFTSVSDVRHSSNFVPGIITKLGGMEEFENGEAIRKLVPGSVSISDTWHNMLQDDYDEETRQFIYGYINAQTPELPPKNQTKRRRAPPPPPPLVPPRTTSKGIYSTVDASSSNDYDNSMSDTCHNMLEDNYDEETRHLIYDNIIAETPELPPKNPAKRRCPPPRPPPLVPPRTSSLGLYSTVDASSTNDYNNLEAATSSHIEDQSKSLQDILEYPSRTLEDYFSEHEENEECLGLEDDPEENNLHKVLAIALAKRNKAFYSEDSADS